jgi:type IV pilus biogenesis protein CpaD/CtpE
MRAVRAVANAYNNDLGRKPMPIRALLVALAISLAAGCTSRPIHNVTAEPVVVTPGKTPTEAAVRDAILRAGTGLGWTMRPAAPGVVNGTIHLRTHTAVIDVEYTTKSYNIVYRSSENLDYRDGQIHKNYNGWIENLDNAIRRELLRI